MSAKEVKMELKERVAIITGGTGALGKAVLSEFLREGAKVISTYIIDQELRGLLSTLKNQNLTLLKADVTREKQVAQVVKRTLKRFGRIDILVNIVGGFTYAKIQDTDEKT